MSVSYTKYTGLTSEQLAGIGFAAVAWNGIEVGLSALTWELARWPKEVGQLVTTDLGNVSKTDLFLNLVGLLVKGERLKEECGDLAMLFNNLRERRNALIHSNVIPGTGESDTPTLVKRSAKGSQPGFITETIVHADPERLGQLAADMKICSEAMPVIFKKIWRVHFYNRLHKANDPTTEEMFVQDQLGSSPQIARLQTRVAELFPKRHARRNKTHPQQPSRGKPQ